MFRLLDEEGWRYSTDSGWNDWDIQIYGNFWWSIALQTVTEYHGAGKCLTRVRLRNRMVITMIIFNLVAISLLIYHQVNVSRVDFWPIVFYLAFLGFLGTRARALKSRVAELVDLAAFRAGLQRVSRKGKPVAPAAGAGTGGCGERDRSRVAAVAWVAHASRVLASASSRSRTFGSIALQACGRAVRKRLFQRDAETSTRDACATHQNFKRTLPVPSSIRPIRFAFKIDIALRALRSATIATIPMPMLKI